MGKTKYKKSRETVPIKFRLRVLLENNLEDSGVIQFEMDSLLVAYVNSYRQTNLLSSIVNQSLHF